MNFFTAAKVFFSFTLAAGMACSIIGLFVPFDCANEAFVRFGMQVLGLCVAALSLGGIALANREA